MLILTIVCPLISSVLVGGFGRRLGVLGSKWIACCGLALSLLALFLTSHLVGTQSQYVSLYTWIDYDQTIVELKLLFDTVTQTMLVVVLLISFIVHLYSTQYLSSDPHLPRFLSFLSLFTFFMLVLVSAENLIQLFVGWEGVGLCSYLLINFWYTRIQANKSALKAVFVNKIGDIALLIGISLIYLVFGTTSFSVIFACTPYLAHQEIAVFGYLVNPVTVIGGFLFLGAVGKSAQIGLHVWLPDAMEGPTPVSALLHAATMVTAGVFLLIRVSPLFNYAPNILSLIVFIGSLTAFFAATTGLLQNDLKRIIAFSTCSQLGYMFVACGLSQYHLGLFHLFNHAFFKALLFLAAGSVIHALSDEQDIRKMGGLHLFLPLTFTFFVIGSLSLMGLPYLSGFFSKDLILEYTLISDRASSEFAGLLLLLAAFFTAAYSFRLLFFVFLSRPNFYRNQITLIAEPSWKTQLPLIFLTLLSIFGGFVFSDLFIGPGSLYFANLSNTQFQGFFPIENEYLTPLQKQLPLLFTVGGVVCAASFLLFYRNINYITDVMIYNLMMFLNQKWFFDKMYNQMFVYGMQRSYFHFFVFLDKGIIELAGPEGLFSGIRVFSERIRFLQPGVISFYLGINLGFLVFFFLFCYSVV